MAVWREWMTDSGTLRVEWLVSLRMRGWHTMVCSNGGQRQHVGVNEHVSQRTRPQKGL
jgi:hypothetical protein